jgi:methionine salvage enolase-phosphatase E1
MESNAITTITKMLESLPENLQNQVVEHLREYIAEIKEEDIHKELSTEEWKHIFSQLIEQIELHTAVGGNSVEDIRRERERCEL